MDSALAKANGAALAYGVPGTPAFVIQRPPALPQSLNVTSLSPEAFSAELTAALQ